MKNMIADGYQDPRTLERRIKAMENGWRIQSCSKQIKMPNTPP